MARNLVVLAILACACAHETVKPVAQVQKPAPPPRLLDLPPVLVYKEARELMADGQWEMAKARLDQYLGKEPKNAAALFDAGWVAEQRGDSAGAMDFYRRSLASDAQNAGSALNLARLLKAQDKLAEAEKVLRGAIGGADPRVLDALAAILRAESKLDEAESMVRRVLARHPRDADAYRNLAGIEADRGHVRLAESALNNARKLDEKDAGILNSLGLLAMRRDDVAAARGYFEEATRLDSGLAAAWANLGAVALSYRDYALAEQAYGKAVLLDGSRWDTHLARGWALEGLKKPKEARGEYEKVLALKPGQEDALYGRAVALKAEGDLPGAMQAFKAYVGLPKAARAKEAQNQIAAIDLRLKNPAPKPAAAAPRPATAETDLSKLPQGTDTGPSPEKLPTPEAEPIALPPPPEPAKDKPAAGKDGGVQNATATGAAVKSGP
jgi:Flp pilus assembly protein TadD